MFGHDLNDSKELFTLLDCPYDILPEALYGHWCQPMLQRIGVPPLTTATLRWPDDAADNGLTTMVNINPLDCNPMSTGALKPTQEVGLLHKDIGQFFIPLLVKDCLAPAWESSVEIYTVQIAWWLPIQMAGACWKLYCGFFMFVEKVDYRTGALLESWCSDRNRVHSWNHSEWIKQDSGIVFPHPASPAITDWFSLPFPGAEEEITTQRWREKRAPDFWPANVNSP